MKAFYINAPGEGFFGEANEPEMGTDDVLLQVERVGLCGSDLNTWRGMNPLVGYPRIPGHEVSGTLLSKGANVPERLEIGMAVTLNPYKNCGRCPACQVGRINACRNNQTLGVQREGAMTSRISVPWERIVVSKTAHPDHLVLIEPMAVGFHAVRRGRVGADETVLVFGCGAIGLGVIAGAARLGARVIAVDINGAKLTLAKAAGAAIGVSPDEVKDTVQSLTHGDGVDVAIEAVGLPETFLGCVDIAAPCGRVVYIGYSNTPVTYDTKLILTKELDVMGSRGALQEDFQEAAAHLESGSYPANDIISRVMPFRQTGDALAYWASDTGAVTKIVVDVQTGENK
ncbi:MAG: zinc-binding alcohol dehydrogenase family protein [Hyphomicrobiales bacterium]